MTKRLQDVHPGDTIKSARPLDHIEELFPVISVDNNIARCAREAWFRLDTGRMLGCSMARFGKVASADDIARITHEAAIRRAQHRLAKLVVTADNLAAVEALLAGGVK